ncbi:MAG: 3'-to-5' oligoribonuclease B [Campylobacteraceae bacterium 4484_4]|nr:MAG: 3'-to-5' oligoribonuclease B [Campylobacteraceae bacterium 4484_4]
MKVYHLSHTDLDGYSCQLVTKKIFDEIEFYNSNYGQEIDERLEQIAGDIESDGKEESLILITDLNLTIPQAQKLEELQSKASGKVDLLLLDHHKTGEEAAKRYAWYHLDVSRSATKITFDYFKERSRITHLAHYVDVVNAIDIWLRESHHFELGKVLMRIVSGAKEINRTMFPKENSAYIFALLEASIPFFGKPNPHIELDNHIHFLKKEFFKNGPDNTLENLVSEYVVGMLSANKERMQIEYSGYTGIMTYGIGNVSIIGNDFLVKNPEVDFFLDINSRKNVSMRANNRVDVSLIAQKLFGGGGHANASGGRCERFRESFVYERMREWMQTFMQEAETLPLACSK